MGQEILERILSSPRLPSLPTIALEVIELVQQPDVDINRIAETIQHDPALSTKILKTVNSSFYGQSKAVSTISQALVILGLNSVKTLALGFSLVNNLKGAGDEGFDHFAFWKRCLYSAVAARAVCREIGLVQQEEALLAGLMQDLGMLAMAQTLGDEYQSGVAEAGQQHRLLVGLEQDRFETDHAELGAELGRAWKLPQLLCEPIQYHEEADNAPEELRQLVQAVSLGGYMADVLVSDAPAEALDAYYRLAADWFEMDRETAELLIGSIHKTTVEMKRLFARANDALINLSLQAAQQTNELQQQTSELQQQNEALQIKAITDPLTGIANRGRFNEHVTEQFAAAGLDAPLSVLFFDTDHFKKFNDTYGHQIGDQVLIEVAKVLTATIPEKDMVARYGGEEFSAVLSQTDRATAAWVAEECRVAVSAMKVTIENGEQLSITASVGAATYHGSFFARVEQLIKAADQAVYAAKAGGRNCVRVFTPQVRGKAA